MVKVDIGNVEEFVLEVKVIAKELRRDLLLWIVYVTLC
jgi:hypothetical protein